MEAQANPAPRNMRIERSMPSEARSAPRAFERQSFQQERQGGGSNNRGSNDQRGNSGDANGRGGNGFRR
jgi:hypothetical protein